MVFRIVLKNQKKAFFLGFFTEKNLLLHHNRGDYNKKVE